MESALNTRELIQILMNIPGIGRERAKKIITFHREGIELGSLIGHLYPFLPIEESHIDVAKLNASALFRKAETENIDICCFKDRKYPTQLLALEDFPLLIYTRGDLRILNRPLGAALVGSRESRNSTLKMTEIIGEILTKKGFTVISGMALGCDTVAHLTALKNKASTIAVMPCGPDVVYPGENRFLLQMILQRNGLVFSEYAPGVPPAPYRFVQRDRLQSGLSHIVVLMESRLQGGAMYAAYSALRQNRPLFVFSPDKYDESTSGNKYLLGNHRVFSFSTPREFDLLMKNIHRIISDCHRGRDQLVFPHV